MQIGHEVIATQFALEFFERGIATVKPTFNRVGRPAMLLGHFYVGAIITAAAAGDGGAGLVYIGAIALDVSETVHPPRRHGAPKSSAHSWLSPVYWHTGALCQAQCFRFFRRSFRQASRYTRWTRLWCTFKSSNIAGSIDALLSQRVSSTIELHPTSIWATSEHRRSIFQVQCSPLKVLWFITFAF
jgi:hypothetical protein